MPILGKKRNQSGTSQKSSRRVKRSQEPVTTPPRSHEEFHTQHIFSFSFLSYEAKLHMHASASSRSMGTIFEWGADKQKKKKRSSPPSRGTARVLLVSCQQKRKKKKKITAFSPQMLSLLGGSSNFQGVLQHPSTPGSQGPG